MEAEGAAGVLCGECGGTGGEGGVDGGEGGEGGSEGGEGGANRGGDGDGMMPWQKRSPSGAVDGIRWPSSSGRWQ